MDDDLHRAAAIFLRGPARAGRGDDACNIAAQAVGQVARKLSACSPASIREIERAVALFRADPSAASRDAVIDAVTCAAAVLQTPRKES